MFVVVAVAVAIIVRYFTTCVCIYNTHIHITNILFSAESEQNVEDIYPYTHTHIKLLHRISIKPRTTTS